MEGSHDSSALGLTFDLQTDAAMLSDARYLRDGSESGVTEEEYVTWIDLLELLGDVLVGTGLCLPSLGCTILRWPALDGVGDIDLVTIQARAHEHLI
jgi:hypothetical protein